MSFSRIALALYFIGCTAVLAATQAEAPLSFVEPVVRISSGSQDGLGEISLRSSVPQSNPPTIKDYDLPHPDAATTSFEVIKDDNPAPNVWRYQVRVHGLTPSGTNQQHYAVVTYGGTKTQTLSYIISNQPASSFSWSIAKIPDPWVASGWWPSPHCVPVVVTTKEFPVTELRPFATLVEQSTKSAITMNDLQLCRRGSLCPSEKPEESINLSANANTDLQICTKAPFHGNYHGNLILASRQKPDGDIVIQNAQFSSLPAKFAGFFLLCAGVYMAWWAKVASRARLERDQALIPAILMRSRVTALQQTLNQLHPDYRRILQGVGTALQSLMNDLDDSVLDEDRFLPPKFPSPYGYTIDSAGYKAYLEARNPRLQLLSVLVNEGIIPAAAEDNGNLSPTQQGLVANAIKNIDDIITAPSPPSADQAFIQVHTIVKTLHDALFPPLRDLAENLAQTPRPPAGAFDALQLEINSISRGIWLIYGILTALSGLVVLILNNPGFGTPLDFAFALFWGFGLPTTIQALAPGSAASALNISIAKN